MRALQMSALLRLRRHTESIPCVLSRLVLPCAVRGIDVGQESTDTEDLLGVDGNVRRLT